MLKVVAELAIPNQDTLTDSSATTLISCLTPASSFQGHSQVECHAWWLATALR